MKRLPAIALALGAGCAPAAFAACNINSGNLSFGTVSPSVSTDSSTTLRLDCNTGAPDPWIRVCIGFGAPVSGDVSNRQMKGPGAALMSYNLYTDAQRTQVWGSLGSSIPPAAFDLPLSGGNVHADIPLYGRVPAGQTGLPGGAYAIPYATSDVRIGTQTFSVAASNCSAIPIDSSITLMNFQVTANLVAGCTVAATLVDFGQRGNLDNAATASGTVTANCSTGVPYTLSMGTGTGAGATLANRLMTRSGGTDTIKYNLYTNAQYTSVWGDGTGGSATRAGVGSGTGQAYTVYARLPAQSPTPPPGTYKDTITLTITY